MNATKPTLCSSFYCIRKNVVYSLLLCSVLLCQVGCNVFGKFNRQPIRAPIVINEATTLDQLVIVLNNQSEKVRQLKTDVRVSMPGAPAMRGTLSVERPRRLRMQAGVAGLTAIDVGSNEEKFWIWTKVALPGQPPTLMYARHAEFESSPIRRQIPLDPAWLVDGIGFAQFLPTDRHEGPFERAEDNYLEIVTYRQTNSGRNVRICVIDPKTGLIRQQSFYDQHRQLIAYVDASKYQYYEEEQVSLPQSLVLTVTGPSAQETKLTLNMGEYSINSLYGDPERLWAMPNPPDVKRIDLSTVQPPIEPQSESANDPDSLSFSRRQPTSSAASNRYR